MLQQNNQEDVCEQGKYLALSERKLLIDNLQADLRPQYRLRIEIMLLADAGKSQTQICKSLGCSQDTARYWLGMLKSGASHTWEQPLGRPKLVNEQYLNRLKELASHSPREYGYVFQRWTAQYLSKHLEKELGISVGYSCVNKLLKEIGLSLRRI